MVEVMASPVECKAVEVNTTERASSPLWVQMREERVTASRLKTVCCTDPAQRSILSICHPEMSLFGAVASQHGCKREADAGKNMQQYYL